MTIFTALDVPDEDVEMVADLVRICRTGPNGMRGHQAMDRFRTLHPGTDSETIERIAGWTARLLDDRY